MRRATTLGSVLATIISGLVALGPPAFAAGGAVEGTATGPGGVAGSEVCVSTYPPSGLSTRTDAQGHYHLDAPDGSYTLLFDDCGARDWVPTFYPAGSNSNNATRVVVAGVVVTGRDVSLPQGGSFNGQLLDTAGSPIPGAGLNAESPSEPAGNYVGRSTTSGSDGHWELHGLPVTSLAVSGWVTGFAGAYTGQVPDLPDALVAPVTPGQPTTIALRLPRSAAISGRITDTGGTPQQSACVTVWTSARSTASVQSDADGRYTVSQVWPFALKVSAVARGCSGVAGWYGGGSRYDQAASVGPGEGGTAIGIDIILPAAPHIAGHVYDNAGSPLQSAMVNLVDGISGRATSTYATTDVSGAYRLSGLASKLYKIQVQPPQTRAELVDLAWPDAFRLVDATTIDTVVGSRDDIDLRLPVGASLRGTVTLADGSAGAQVCVSTVPALAGMRGTSARTAADGTFQIQGMGPGLARVKMKDCSGVAGGSRAPGPTMWRGTDDPRSGQVLDLALDTVVSAVDQMMPVGGSMHGVVTDASGAGLALCMTSSGFLVNRPSLSYAFTNTDANGNWELHGLSPGTYSAEVAACSGSVGRPVGPVQVTAGGDTAAPPVALQHGGSLRGVVLNQYGSPVQDVCIAPVYRGEGFVFSSLSAHTDANGQYLMTGLQPGPYTARFVECGAGIVPTWYQSPVEATSARFDVAPDQETALSDQTVITLSVPSLPLSVLASPLDRAVQLTWKPPTDDGHAPISGYAIATPSGSLVGRVSGAARSFQVSGLSNGSQYRFTVSAVNSKGASQPATTPAVVPAALGMLTIRGPSTTAAGTRVTVAGTLLTSSGGAYPGRTLTLLSRPTGSTASWHAVAHPVTGTGGTWRSYVTPGVPTVYRVTVGSKAASLVLKVAPRLTLTATGRTLSVSTAPARPGSTVYLQRYGSGTWATAYTRVLGSTGRTSVTARAGIYRAVMHAAGYWSPATSPTLRLA